MNQYFTLRPSLYLRFILTASCLLLLLAEWSLPFALALRIAIGAFAIGVCIYVHSRDARLSLAHSCVGFRIEDEGGIGIILRDGQHQSGKISIHSVVMPWLVLLSIQLDERGRRSLVLMPDSMSADDFRRLRVALRWLR